MNSPQTEPPNQSWGKRVNRASYFGRLIILTLTFLATLAGIGIFSIESTPAGIITLVIWGSIVYSFIKATIGRLHDLNLSGWWSLLFLIPGIGEVALLYLLLAIGTIGANDYGPDPLKEKHKQSRLVCPNCQMAFTDFALRLCPDCKISLSKP